MFAFKDRIIASAHILTILIANVITLYNISAAGRNPSLRCIDICPAYETTEFKKLKITNYIHFFYDL